MASDAGWELTGWSALVDAGAFASVVYCGQSCHRSGWPLLALERWSITAWPDATGGWDLRWAWPLDPPSTTRARRALPLRPVWPGFVLDTALYAAGAWTLVAGPSALRRTLRRRRGQCRNCAYSRAGLAPEAPCPECGRTGA